MNSESFNTLNIFNIFAYILGDDTVVFAIRVTIMKQAHASD